MQKLNKYSVTQNVIYTWYVEAFDKDDALDQARVVNATPSSIDESQFPSVVLLKDK
jgi:hypothetical protein